jgi:hypothetical protein
VRRYGPDYADRLAEAGFLVEMHHFSEELGARVTERCGLEPNEAVYLCRRP